MFRVFSLTLLLASLLCCACNKDKPAPRFSPTGDYLIVGQTGGFINPTAPTPYYLVADGALREDGTCNADNLPTTYSGFNFNNVLPQARYDSVAAGVLANIPPELLPQSGAGIGKLIPDVGYTDVRVRISGVLYNWHFLPDQSSSDTAVQKFVSAVCKIMQ